MTRFDKSLYMCGIFENLYNINLYNFEMMHFSKENIHNKTFIYLKNKYIP